MAASNSLETDELLRRAGAGESAAIENLLDRHRRRLRQMVVARFDRRLNARVDPSDVLQDGLADAGRRLPDFLRNRPMPFFCWLRRLVLQRLGAWRRFHLETRSRSVARDGAPICSSIDGFQERAIDRLAGSDISPSDAVIRDEEKARMRCAVASLDETDRQVLMLRYEDQFSFAEIAVKLGAKLSAVKMRHLRALERLRGLMGDYGREPGA
jgi:RNA polymerase sigma-70 factor (ECF subfamily)